MTERPVIKKARRIDTLPIDVNALIIVARSMIDQEIVPDSCYMHSEALARACRDLGYDAEPVLADAYYWNDSMHRVFLNQPLRRAIESNPMMMQQHIIHYGEPKFVGIFHGQDVEGPGYNGHVVVRVEDQIIDVTFSQFSRPDHGIHPPAIFIAKTKHFGKPHKLRRMVHLIEGCSVRRNQVLTNSTETGHFCVCLRPDRKVDYLDLRPDTRANIHSLHQDLLEYMPTIQEELEKLVGASAKVEDVSGKGKDE